MLLRYEVPHAMGVNVLGVAGDRGGALQCDGRETRSHTIAPHGDD